jgi:tape measure domain-containing protein
MANFADVVISFKSEGASKVKGDTSDIAVLMKGLAGQIGIATTATDLAVQAFGALINTIKSVSSAIYQNTVSYDTAIRSLAIYQTDALALENQLQRLVTIAQDPGLTIEQVLQGVNYLQQAGYASGLAERSIRNFGRALFIAGKGKEELNGVSLALGQIKAKGIISAEEINQIAERVPQIRTALIDAFGTGNTKKIQEMKITATDFLDQVNTKLEKILPTSDKMVGGLQNFTDKMIDQFKRVSAIVGKGFSNLFIQPGGPPIRTEFFDMIKNAGIELNQIFTSLAESDFFIKMRDNIYSLLISLKAFGPIIANSFKVGLSIAIALFDMFVKVVSYQANFLGQLLTNPIGLWNKEVEGMKTVWNNLTLFMSKGWDIFVKELQYGFSLLNLNLDKFLRQPTDFSQAEMDRAKIALDLAKASSPAYKEYKPTPLFKAVVSSTFEIGTVVDKAVTAFADMEAARRSYGGMVPQNIQLGLGLAGRKDEKVADDAKKAKKQRDSQLKQLELISNNTKKANELTLRDLTYGGGQLAARGLSRVEQSANRQVSSPQLNASNDIVRGIEKMIRMYSNSNNLNFSFRRT